MAMATTYIDLVLDDGELVRIECPSEHDDELLETIDVRRKRRDWWCPNQFDGCNATYMGYRLERVNMARVVGTL